VVAFGSAGSPATAKNCIAVGASENSRPNFSIPQLNHTLEHGAERFSGQSNPSRSGRGNPDGMAAFSSRGPAMHGRVRPDVVAPSTAILSTKSRIAAGEGWAMGLQRQTSSRFLRVVTPYQRKSTIMLLKNLGPTPMTNTAKIESKVAYSRRCFFESNLNGFVFAWTWVDGARTNSPICSIIISY
jgi:hypothetical protein